jgi:AcrR family transcriptional regulator
MSIHSYLATRIPAAGSAVRSRPRTTPRKLPKQERSRATIEAILGATAHILVRDGFEGASTNRIAERAGVSIGSLYQYFPSKEALVAALLERHVREMRTFLAEAIPRAMSQPLRDAVRDTVRLMIEAHALRPELHRVFVEQVPRIGRLERVSEVERRFEAMTRSWLEERRHEIRPRNLDLAAFVAVQAVECLTHAAVLHHPEKLRSAEFVEEVTELVVRYLARDPQA